MSDRTTPPTTHPLFRAGKEVASDLLSTLVFVGLYAVTHNVAASVGLAIAVGLGRIIYQARRRIPIDAMQWLSLFLVIVFGGAALITHNPLFIMLKPTLVYAAIGLVMLRSGWMNRYVPPIVQTNAPDTTVLFGYLWAALMFGTGALNLAVALHASTTTWAWFIGVFPLASKIALILVQYSATRSIVRRRLRAARLVAVPAV
ncbi:MAG TPA: septation protein IspZ [Acetobacteraceae bacterium]|nr:septation protein IspZ [Acetobacteraceae bacterium]